MQDKIFPLKKYKDQPMEVVLQDRNYCEWLAAQSWFREKFKPYYQIIINNFGEPGETPEHNALQARFLDDRFCLALGNLCKWKLMNKNACIRNLGKAIRLAKELNPQNDYEYNKNLKRMEEISEMREDMNESIIEWEGKELMDGEPFFKMKTIFEQDWWDVIIKTDDTYCKNECIIWKDCDINFWKIAVEIKPLVGDDYPEILRKMNNRNTNSKYKCLIYDNFYAEKVTLEEVKKKFASLEILVFSINEIETEMQNI